MRNNLATLQRLVQQIEARGSRVYFYSLPLARELEDSAAAMATAATAHANFPDDRRWLHLDGSTADLRWGDGLHLDERSAVIVSQSIDRELSLRLEPR
jgi:hypothetical protein